MQRLLSCLALLLFGLSIPAQAVAQDISANMAALKKGQTLVYRSSERGLYTQLFVGKKNGLYVFHVLHGDSASGTPFGKFLADEKGQTVERHDEQGNTERFEPHDCRRTVGKCDFLYTNKSGKTVPLQSFVRPTKQGFVMTLREKASRALVVKRRNTLMENGLSKAITLRFPDGRQERFRFIRFGP